MLTYFSCSTCGYVSIEEAVLSLVPRPPSTLQDGDLGMRLSSTVKRCRELTNEGRNGQAASVHTDT